MKVNIVMLTKDRNRLFRQAIRSLYMNTPTELFNLTVVDDGSAEHMVMATESSCTLRIEGSKGITGQARNLGIYWAEKYWGRGDYLYLSDNDMYFTPGWLEKMVDMMSHCDIDLLGGWNHPFLQPKQEIGQKAFGHIGCAIYGHYAMTHDAVAGASQLMRWKIWDKYGPLDAHAKGVGQSEDWKFCRDIQMPLVTDKYDYDGHDVMTKGGGIVASIYPRVVLNCGLTNSFGQQSPGADVMLKELQEAKLKYSDLYWG